MTAISPIIQLHPQVKAALIHPQRAMEVRGWLKTNKLVAQQWKGDDGESMMHWAFLSEWVLAAELKEIGLSYDTTDNMGRTPMDWINDRLWYSVVETNTNGQLSAGGKERLRRHSEQQIQALWAQGARPSFNSRFIHPGVVWLRAGAWDLINLLKDDDVYSWFQWAPQGGHALHSWILSPNTPQRRAFLKNWADEFDVDLGDNDNRSALWYAVEGWLARPEFQKDLSKVIRELLEEGANPFKKDDRGESAYDLLNRALAEGAPDRHKIESLMKLLKTNYVNELYESPPEDLDENEQELMNILSEPSKNDINVFEPQEKDK